ncbi:HAD family hydrolase [Janibacter anophelis]|uniref:HAD family hydrolase n=1 Tax=Janibacter anophelis TaxID=319054 RepID=UPI000DEF61AE|nr:HAD family hydrolase [Janibacter anophelis]
MRDTGARGGDRDRVTGTKGGGQASAHAHSPPVPDARVIPVILALATRRAICFDLDGTLADSLPDIIGSFAASLVEHGLPHPGDAPIRALVGLPLVDMFTALAPTADIAALSATYRRIYPTRFTQSSRPFDESAEVLEQLRARGYLLAVTTTKGSPVARELVTALGLAEHLDHVQGTDGFPAKPAPDVIHRALGELDADGTWMVGDTTHDIGAGRAAGLRTYAVCRPGATHDRDTLAAADPDHLEGSLLPLLDLV